MGGQPEVRVSSMTSFWVGLLVGFGAGALVTYVLMSVWIVRTLRPMAANVRKLLERSPRLP